LKVLMQLFDELPTGLWLVKRVDRFQFQHHESESAAVEVTFQQLPFTDIKLVPQLRGAPWAEIVGRPPRTRDGAEAEPPIFIFRTLLAGFVARMQVGDIYEGTRRVARIPTQSRRVTLDHRTRVIDGHFGDRAPSEPPGWKAETFQILNQFEFSLKGVPGAAGSRCIVFFHEGTEYILPKMVIFQAFYACHSRMVNALCNESWAKSAAEVISFARYESGITTGVDPETGAWKIVLQTGLDQSLANILAFHWFDPYARKQTDAIYSDALDQISGRPGGHGRSWLAGANIPHSLGQDPFVMHVQGLSLRPFRPTTPKEFHERFLITAITGSSWSLKNQRVEWELHNSGSAGIDRRTSEVDKPYFGGKLPVEGDPDAVGVSSSDPSTRHAINEFTARPFEYLNAPPPVRQQKKSSQSFSQASTLEPEGPSSLVSAGNPTHGHRTPAPAAMLTPIRDSSQQFSFLVDALTVLKSKGDISSFSPIEAVDDSGHALVRNGLPCWSLLGWTHRTRGTVPKSGWEVIKDGAQNSGAERRSRKLSRYARCVLILSIRIGDRELMLFEIEQSPRLNANGYRMVAFEPTQVPALQNVIPVLNEIREKEGTFKEQELQAAFSPLTSRPVSSRKHWYVKSTAEESSIVTGLRSDLLHQWFVSLLQK
jgi:hypothetical protein